MIRISIAVLCSLALTACAPTHPGRRDRPPEPAPVPDRAPERARAEPAPRREPIAPARIAAAPTAPAPSREGWNDAQIDWVPYDAALARARVEGRPVCVVMHADWCVHCRNYSHVFEDPRIVERASRMLMVLLDVDAEPDVARRYALDGGYVPRTYFVAPDGATLGEIDARRAQFRYFFDEHDASSLLAAMDTVLARP